MTTNHPAHGPVSLDRLYQISEILSKAAAQSDGGNIGYAMADAVKVIDVAIAAFGAEPVAGEARFKEMHHWSPCTAEHVSMVLANPAYWPNYEVRYLYTAPPSPVAMEDHQIRELVNELRDIAIEYHGTQQLRERIARTVRAAMLQAGNHTEQHLDMVDHSGDANEKGSDGTFIDEGTKQAGNYPETPDSWVMVPKEMTCEMDDAAWDAYHETRCMSDIWAALLAAAPQQEVNRG